MEENPIHHNNEQMPYGENDIPYYEYSSLGHPLQPLVPSPLPQMPPLPSSPAPQALPPKSSRNRALLLILAVVSVVLVVAVVFLTVLSQVLFQRPISTKTPSAVSPTQSSTQPITPSPAFRASSCPFQVGAGIVDGQTVKCGYVSVPESRKNANGTKVQLAVAIFKSPTVQNDPLPVLRLEGGPGGPSLDNWAHYVTRSNLSSFVFNHDLIMFDQRGTGYSTPSLKCSEILQLQYNTLNTHLSASDTERLQLQALQTCHDRLVKSGVDLNAFNSLENAADVHDLILALGYKQANLYGVSYGTRLALTTIRLFPAVIRSVVLDSVYPPQKNRTDLPSAAQRVFNVLFQGCAADTHCSTQYPHLDSVFYQLVTDLNANPVHFQTTNATTGKSYNVVMAGDDFVFVLFGALYVTQFIPALPKMIFQVRDHAYTLLSQIYGNVQFDDTFSDGMFYSDECSEDWSFVTQNDIGPALQGITPQIRPALQNNLQQEYDSCRLWNVQKAPAVQKQPVVSDIPTLVLTDEYDPITPPANGKLAAQTLKNSYYFLFPGLGHGAEYNARCVNTIISAFDDTPTQQPSSACVASMGEPNFV
ncbi:MAG: alpha/beta fold hydrolase [Ktedonobacteraceae bacterium]